MRPRMESVCVRDPRLNKLADVIVGYSTRVQRGDLARLSGEPIAAPLMEAMYERMIRAGANVIVRMVPDSFEEIFYKNASDEQLSFVPPLLMQEVESIDVSIGLWCETNPKALTNVDPSRQARESAARKPVFKRFMQRFAEGKLRWCGTLYPTMASAQDAEMSLSEYEDFVFGAGKLDSADPVAEWEKLGRQQQQVVEYLTGKKELRFRAANGTDLRVNVEGMTWINCNGKENFPDGEVFTGPNLGARDGGVNGVVRYSFPAVHGGREVHGIELTFEKGRVVKAEAERGREFLIKMLDQDEGARSLGEIALGTNYGIKRYTKNTLFDEKIGGTFHAAVGAGYPESGNHNESGLHWDMVCDLREGGTIEVDGQVISRDGKFVFDGWPGT